MSRSCLGLMAAAVVAIGLWASPARAVPVNEGKHIDVVLCLDVSGSMQGLISSAKVKLWEIVNELARVKPAPNLRVALYSYGHTTYSPKDGWVRKDIDLTTDLDEVYKKLNGLTINGGEEYVARVSKAALTEQKWCEQKDGLRLIFVCGNEPVDQDKEVSLSEVAKLAKEKGVVVNTIYCNWGNGKPNEGSGYNLFAAAAGGKYAMIEHDERLAQIQSPFDKDLLTLNAKLNDTFLAYGGKPADAKKENQLRQDANAQSAGPQAASGRVATKGGALYKNADWCVISRCAEDPKFDVTKLKADELPPEMKNMKPEERVAFVKKKIEDRAKVQKDIADVSSKRTTWLGEEMKKNASSAGKQLDAALKLMIREQGAAKGIEIPK